MVEYFGIREKQFVTPDKMVVPELGIQLRFDSPDAVVFTLHGDEFYTGGSFGSHPMIYRVRDLWGAGIDGRIWKDRKIVSFWYRDGDANPLYFMENINEKYNIEGFSVVFIGRVEGLDKIVCCPYEEIPEIRKFVEPTDTEDVRWNWPVSLAERRGKIITFGKYDEHRRYWNERLGGMDVAEYHLLAYEE